jgi:chromosome segregation protein
VPAVFLRSLTLKGFKSFADATTLVLEPGVTVVVGPNGSGKSNVVDAIAWVLGAQAPSAVRSQKMDDVIFAGTASRSALGRAEVSLTIDNSAGVLPIEFSEVTIKRTPFRNGDSEYAINNVPCRLIDVQELLSDARVGRQQHVIVSQGQIDAVLNARPEDRRAIVEEAAGVLKYRRRKEKAERRLEATEASLLRVQDLVREVRRQLRPLERQAAAAQRHGELAAEIAGLRVYVAGREIAALRTKLTALAGLRLQSADNETRLKSELANLDADVLALGAELTARGADDVSVRLARAEQLRERAKGLAAVIAERARGLERDRGQLLDEAVVATMEADAARHRAELDEVRKSTERADSELDELASDETAFAIEREALLGSLEAVPAATATNALAEVRGELRTRVAAVERAEAELLRCRTRCDALTARLGELDRLSAQHRHDCAAIELLEGPLLDEIAAADRRVVEAEVARQTAVQRARNAAEEASNLASRVAALQLAVDAARDRAGAKHLAGGDGVLGTLLDLVRIEPGWEPAVEAALGEALAAVVVADADAAARALRALRGAATCGAVIPLGLAAADVDGSHAIGDPVRPHVTCDRADVARLLDVVLANASRVDDFDAAIAAAAEHPRTIVVTAAGDRLAGTSWRVGAAAAGGVTASALDEAHHSQRTAMQTVASAEAEEREAAAAEVTARRHASELAERLDANDRRFTTASEALARVQSERREINVEDEPLRARIEGLSTTLAADRERIAELEALMPELEAGESAEADAARRRQQLRAELDARTAVLSGRRRDLEVRSAGLRERADFLEQRLAETEGRLAADAEARAGAAQRRTAIERVLAALACLAAYLDGRRATIDRVHDELSEQRRRHSDEVAALAARLDERRSLRVAAERQLDEVRERARRAEVDEAEARLRLESAVEMLRHDCDVEPEVAEAAEAPALPDGVTPQARVRELDRELRLLGPINPLALEEFAELQQRHTFLDEQLEDVRTTRRELTRVIKAVDHEIQTVFAAAYADVADHFAGLFGNLFPGGTGRLILTQPDDLLNTGIEVEAKPGGKNVKKLTLLSGGERSLTALAFLFAVFRSRPSPFYVMDEVEAALDDINLHRFLTLLAEFRQEAQLMVVSHQKRTMEAADCLFGVTMQPGGSSKVISERIAVA